jgi:hypothetical protein
MYNLLINGAQGKTFFQFTKPKEDLEATTNLTQNKLVGYLCLARVLAAKGHPLILEMFLGMILNKIAIFKLKDTELARPDSDLLVQTYRNADAHNNTENSSPRNFNLERYIVEIWSFCLCFCSFVDLEYFQRRFLNYPPP